MVVLAWFGVDVGHGVSIAIPNQNVSFISDGLVRYNISYSDKAYL
jgi:hypothetical protein